MPVKLPKLSKSMEAYLYTIFLGLNENAQVYSDYSYEMNRPYACEIEVMGVVDALRLRAGKKLS